MAKKPSSRALAIIDLDALPVAQTSTHGNSTAMELPRVEEADLLGERVRQELEWIETSRAMIPVRAVFLGIVLAQIRASLDRGKWMPWLKKYFGKKNSTAYKYIKIAKKCVIEARIQFPEMIALRQLQLDLKTSNPKDDAAKALRKMRKWVAKRSLEDLLSTCDDEPGPSLGGARNRPPKPAVNVDALKALKREEAAGLIEKARALLLRDNILQYLTPKEVRHFVENLGDILTEVREAVKPLLKEKAAS